MARIWRCTVRRLRLSASAVSFGGRISLHVLGVSPLIERAQLERVVLRTATALDLYVAESLGL